MGTRVLIVEDQQRVAQAISLLLELNDIDSVTVADPARALETVADRDDIGLVIQDMNFSPGKTSGQEGTDLFRSLKDLDPELPILVITAWGSVEAAVELMKGGAGDYFEKPWNDERLLRSVQNLLRLRSLQVENDALKGNLELRRRKLSEQHDLCGLIYRSAAMHELVALAVRVARADVPVLITGAHGTGKEKLAEVIQANSSRRDRPFVRVNVGALPDDLIEAELFGTEAGAFTGANKRRIGRFEAADGGTLLLDEIGNLSAAGQMKLLRVLQTGEMERLGSSQTRKVDVRVLAATNSDLPAAIARGRFREDLYFRLNVIELRIPPLCDRPRDILPLAEAFLQGIDTAPRAPRLGPEAQRHLETYPWPGNVRQLQNTMQRAALMAAGDVLGPADLGLPPVEGASQGAHPPQRATPPQSPAGAPEDADRERRRIERTLLECGGVVAHAAESLGLSRQALYRRMQRLGIVLERRPRA
ncbi:MAG: sigma-54 dependent transcriptional regulator [Acidobacteriota bacterium]